MRTLAQLTGTDRSADRPPAAVASGVAAGETGGLLRYLQSGNVQRYMVFLFVGIVALAVIFTSVT